MKSKLQWLPKPLTYNGMQLKSKWIQEVSGLEGNAVVAFSGPADVPIENMVDLEDVARNAPIYSEAMLHFICEIFDKDLEKMVLRQRLLIAILHETLLEFPQCSKIARRGDDLYDGDAKLSVSIATSSPVSCLIHTGINISHENTPVLTKGLKDYEINPQKLGEEIMHRFVKELSEIDHATTKVRQVL
ncbi:MAG: DUF366 family protein [Deltaproteobacteria bacterium]|nr:DUF366 family protein [Deltaproteobacteria bacterium]